MEAGSGRLSRSRVCRPATSSEKECAERQQRSHSGPAQQGHITSLSPVTGDSNSSAIAISNQDLVLGLSLNASFSPRAALWRNGNAIDLNTLVPADSTLYLQFACSINDKGEIIGFAALKSTLSESHAYLAKPVANSGDRD